MTKALRKNTRAQHFWAALAIYRYPAHHYAGRDVSRVREIICPIMSATEVTFI